MPFRKFTCQTCGHVYDEAEGDPAAGIAQIGRASCRERVSLNV